MRVNRYHFRSEGTLRRMRKYLWVQKASQQAQNPTERICLFPSLWLLARSPLFSKYCHRNFILQGSVPHGWINILEIYIRVFYIRLSTESVGAISGFTHGTWYAAQQCLAEDHPIGERENLGSAAQNKRTKSKLRWQEHASSQIMEVLNTCACYSATKLK